ncbi:Snf7-domain-containing protein [Tribonema minus]|uniref:Snf7-domain-containing protein n=1 Tax=Tribonema minus TaxID=303371 RepID=A0A836CAA0_9STRA|nr:Snf7-domain-containing protein [Tribonema minus]
MNLFGKKKSAASGTPTDPTPTIMKLQETIDTLEKRETHLQKKIKAQLLEAKAKSQTDKKGALFALKRKKMYEAEINKINGARITLEQQKIALEGSNTNLQTFQAMNSGRKAMQAARGQLDVDDVDAVMDDIQEEMDIADQIGEAIARPAEGLFDDDDLLAELGAMEEAEMEETLLAAPAVPARPPSAAMAAGSPTLVVPGGARQPVAAGSGSSGMDLPSVPTGDVRVPAAEEDEDLRALRELEASML